MPETVAAAPTAAAAVVMVAAVESPASTPAASPAAASPGAAGPASSGVTTPTAASASPPAINPKDMAAAVSVADWAASPTTIAAAPVAFKARPASLAVRTLLTARPSPGRYCWKHPPPPTTGFAISVPVTTGGGVAGAGFAAPELAPAAQAGFAAARDRAAIRATLTPLAGVRRRANGNFADILHSDATDEKPLRCHWQASEPVRFDSNGSAAAVDVLALKIKDLSRGGSSTDQSQTRMVVVRFLRPGRPDATPLKSCSRRRRRWFGVTTPLLFLQTA